MSANPQQACCCCSCKTDVSNTTYAADGGTVGNIACAGPDSGLALSPSLSVPPPPGLNPVIAAVGPCIWYTNLFGTPPWCCFQVFYAPSGGVAGVPKYCYVGRLLSIGAPDVIFWEGYNVHHIDPTGTYVGFDPVLDPGTFLVS